MFIILALVKNVKRKPEKQYEILILCLPTQNAVTLR